MRKRIIIIAVLIVVAAPVVVYFGFPGLLYKANIAGVRRAAGLVKKEIKVDDHTIVYLEGGKGPVVLLVHGFSAEKDHWARFAKHLTPRYHVVVPDLPGFGESSKIMTDVYDYKSQVGRIKKFCDVLKIEKFHIAGNSMGGGIAGFIAVELPEKVLSLGLFDNAGITPPKKSEVQIAREKGENPLVAKSAEDFERVMNLNFFKPLKLPRPVVKYLAGKAFENAPFNSKIYKDMSDNPFDLQPKLGLIKAPVLVIWGDNDRVLDKSAVTVLQKGLPRSTVVIMKECGHVPMLERPDETAKNYLDFLSKI